jgi:hypothetical protein
MAQHVRLLVFRGNDPVLVRRHMRCVSSMWKLLHVFLAHPLLQQSRPGGPRLGSSCLRHRLCFLRSVASTTVAHVFDRQRKR